MKLDRTAFCIQTHEQEEATKVFKTASYAERLTIAAYLNSVAYNYDVNHPPKVDRTYFSMRKRD